MQKFRRAAKSCESNCEPQGERDCESQGERQCERINNVRKLRSSRHSQQKRLLQKSKKSIKKLMEDAKSAIRNMSFVEEKFL
jgi:hypothetical protein